MVDWSELPPEILYSISQWLTLYADYLRFRSVCHSWRSSVPETPLHLPPQLPCLLLSLRSFFDLSTHKTHLLNLPPSSPHTRICGSSHGWLVILDDTPNIRLLNPVTRKTVPLPPFHTFPNVVNFSYSNVGREYTVRTRYGVEAFSLRQMCKSFVKKVVLSSSPLDSHEFAAVAIVGDYKLAFYRNGYDSWVSLGEELESESFCWEDVVYNDGSFNAVSKGGAIAFCNVNFKDFVLPQVWIFNTQGLTIFSDIHYAVISGEEMLLVARFLEWDFFDGGDEPPDFVYKTVGFEVFKMDWDAKKWERIETLGERVLFVGDNSSLSFCASEFVGCSADCIYFTDNYSELNHEDAYGIHDLGIFRLRDKSIEPLPCFPPFSNPRLERPLPVWVSPNPL